MVGGWNRTEGVPAFTFKVSPVSYEILQEQPGLRPAPYLASRGMNYKVLGVGNRNGVYIQLIGCFIAVVGMIYAFYVKPAIKRSRQRRVAEQLAENAS